MTRNILLFFICCLSLSSFAGDYITYQQKTIPLSPLSFFIDARLSDEEAARQPFVFNNINEALKHITDGTEENPMTLYIAPYVYWIDDPDDAQIRKPEEGGIPYGIKVKCNWLKFYGLTENPQDVILASQRGQTQGAEGNFTMFHFDGDGISTENITFGNYCNVDLEYPLLLELNRPKRSSTITQAQLIICNSDKVVARNTHFISRLNLCPFAGAKRILFDNCYFESTDDALCGTGVYLNSRFTFFSSKPFHHTQGTGSVFLNCDIQVLTQNKQYLTKVGSPVTLVDTRFTNNSSPLFIGWTQDPANDLRCYQYNVTLNNKQIRVNEDKPWLTVDMTGKQILDAYRVEHKGEVIYNTYNLLRGNDDWDPMGVKQQLMEIEKQTGKNLTSLPTYLKIRPAALSIESGTGKTDLEAIVMRFGNYQQKGETIAWSVNRDGQELVSLRPQPNNRCEVEGTNTNDETKTVLLQATTPLGIESASTLTVAPPYLIPPLFTKSPQIKKQEKGKLTVDYTLPLEGRKDESLITWYRCTNAQGNNPIEVAVSRLNTPKYIYELSLADVGYYIMATVAPKHLRSHPGKEEKAVSSKVVAEKDIVTRNRYYTDFLDFPTNHQPQIIPGFWTVDVYKPLDLKEYNWEPSNQEAWYYGKGQDGMKGTGLVQTIKGARLLYTPVARKYSDMTVTINVDPGKQAGQGFGSATGQYMDIYIKYDTQTLSGYGLRIIRTTKFDHAVDFILMKYEKGVSTEISQPLSAVCYRTGCTIKVSVKGNIMTAHAETKTELPEPTHPDLKKTVDLQATITPTDFGGVGIQHTGSTGANATMLHELQIDWE